MSLMFHIVIQNDLQPAEKKNTKIRYIQVKRDTFAVFFDHQNQDCCPGFYKRTSIGKLELGEEPWCKFRFSLQVPSNLHFSISVCFVSKAELAPSSEVNILVLL